MRKADHRFAYGFGRGAGPGGLARWRAALLLCAALLSPPSSAAAAKPGYVIQAENNYRQARQAARALEHELDQLNQRKAREGQRALAKHGQWIEPAGLWRKTRATERNLAFARMHEQHTRTELNTARDTARRKRVGGFPNGEFQPSTSWRPRW